MHFTTRDMILASQNISSNTMSDPLSISASVAGLLGLMIQVADSTYKYVSSVRGASVSISSLLEELRALKTVLVKLDDITHDNDYKGGDSVVLSLLDIDACRVELERLKIKLEGSLGTNFKAKAIQRMIWPFLKDTTVGIVQKLHRYVDIFHLALSTDTLLVKVFLSFRI
jgi:hypothetical protein